MFQSEEIEEEHIKSMQKKALEVWKSWAGSSCNNWDMCSSVLKLVHVVAYGGMFTLWMICNISNVIHVLLYVHSLYIRVITKKIQFTVPCLIHYLLHLNLCYIIISTFLTFLNCVYLCFRYFCHSKMY